MKKKKNNCLERNRGVLVLVFDSFNEGEIKLFDLRVTISKLEKPNQLIFEGREITRARENFIFKTLRVESMNYCFKRPPPKFQPQIRSIIAHSIKSLK
jgi:hypothetical protein